MIFSQKKVIVIDPGHGGKDPGAIGINGIKEKDVTLNFAKKILHLNKTLFSNKFDIYLTRYKDTLIVLSDRTKVPKALQADVFISVHCNSIKSSARAKGIEVFINSKESYSLKLATNILKEITQELGFKKRGIKYKNFRVLRTHTNCSKVLIELGFITNKDEAAYYMDAKNIKALALAMLIAVKNYFEQIK